MGKLDTPEKTLRWGPEQRLEFIEFLLFWEGAINRSDITDRFGVSVPQASNDLTAYRDLAPNNLSYDASGKRYVSTARFSPRLLKPNPDRYLAQLKAVSDGIIDIGDTWISNSPQAAALPIPSRRIDAQVLRALFGAVREKCAIRIEYQSMSRESPDPIWRWITPHAFGFDGLRWHVRAFCHRKADFLDFIIGRCSATAEIAPAGGRAEDDWQWRTLFDVVLQPNPELAEGQRRAIALDYGMSDGQVTVPVRHALLYYFNKRLRLDVAAHLDAPHERPVVVANQSDFTEALAKATAQPKGATDPGSPAGRS